MPFSRAGALAILLAALASSETASTYAQRLGWSAQDRVLILHMDDAGMSHDSNAGIEEVLEHGVARSLSVMMPTPWVPEIVHYLQAHPGTDAGLHLTLTSEWKSYRWGPLAGRAAVPGLVDSEGALWRSVEEVASHASPAEVDRELRAQLDRAEQMGFHPTHLDTHMGTVYATPEFLAKYVQLGIEKQIPVMVPGGHDTYIAADRRPALNASGQNAPDPALEQARAWGEQLWRAGLPVLDDLHNTSYEWKIPAAALRSDDELRRWRTRRYIETLSELKPGLTMVIMHCTSPSPVFAQISDSGPLRKADMLAMLDPELRSFLVGQRFVITTWREASERRKTAR